MNYMGLSQVVSCNLPEKGALMAKKVFRTPSTLVGVRTDDIPPFCISNPRFCINPGWRSPIPLYH